MPSTVMPFQNDSGTFTLNNLAPGHTDLQVTARGFASTSVRGLEVEEGKATTDVDVHMERGATVKGRVTTSDGQPLESVNVYVVVGGRGIMMGSSTFLPNTGI